MIHQEVWKLRGTDRIINIWGKVKRQNLPQTKNTKYEPKPRELEFKTRLVLFHPWKTSKIFLQNAIFYEKMYNASGDRNWIQRKEQLLHFLRFLKNQSFCEKTFEMFW